MRDHELTSSQAADAFVIAAIVFGVRLAMAALGRTDVLGVHGVIVMLFGGVVLYLIMSSAYGPEPTEDRAASYYDDPTKVGIVLAMFWAVIGMFMGSGWRRSSLADLAFDAAWSGFWTASASSHLRRHLRVRWQCAHSDLVPCRAANFACAPRQPDQPVVRASGLQPLLHSRRVRLSARRDTIEGGTPRP